MKAADYFDSQVDVPTELRTREMELLPVSVREAAHWSAGVDDAEVLQAMDDVRRREAAGELSRTESRKELRLALKRLGYVPAPGTEGTIKDLLSVRRQNVYLDTNTAQARGWLQWTKQQEGLEHFPAVRLVRTQQRKVHRDWVTRWNAAREATLTEGSERASKSWSESLGEPGPMCLANHPLLLKLSRFGLPYDPLDFNTGMRRILVNRADAEAAGIIEEGAEQMLVPQVRSLNQALERTPELRAEFRAGLSAKLKGFAKWEGERLIFTDPNGLRPISAKDVPNVIKAPLPAGFQQLQLQALQDYVSRPGRILRTPWTDAARDFARLLHRVEPSPVAPLLEGVIPLGPEEAAQLLAQISAQPMTLPVPLQLTSGTANASNINLLVIDAPGVKDLGHAFPGYLPIMKFLPAGTRLELVEAHGATLVVRVVAAP